MADNSKGTVVAAAISAGAVVVAAWIATWPKPDKPDPAATSSTTAAASAAPLLGPTPSPTEAAAALPPLHRVTILNNCERPFRIRFYYHGARGWTSNGGSRWHYEHGEDDYPTAEGQPLTTDSADIYFHATRDDGLGEWNGNNYVEIAGQNVGFRKAEVVSMANGDYQVPISCDGTATPS